MLQVTGQHVAKQQNTLVVRTRDAGVAFVEETRDAGIDFIRFVGTEAKRWKRYVRQRATTLGTDARDALAPNGLERKILVGIGGTLRALDARVRVRLASLDKKSRKAPARRRPVARKKALAAKTTASPALAA
jgi:hypothetical protein